MRNKSFTLIEVLLAFAIFVVIMGLVLITLTGAFRSLRQAEVFLLKEQKERSCLLRLSREVSSLTRIDFPQLRFKGNPESFFLSSPERIT